MRSIREKTIQFFKKYGKSLHYLKLPPSGLDESLLRLVRKECPQAYSVFFRSLVRSLMCHGPHRCPANGDWMVALGASLVSLTISKWLWTNEPIRETLFRIGQACRNLTTCRLIACKVSLDAFHALFEVPKPILRRFDAIVSERDSSTPTNIFQVLAEKVSSIKELIYTGQEPPVKLLASFVAANKQLRKVRLSLPVNDVCQCRLNGDCTTDGHREDWYPFVSPFWQSPSLLELDCYCRKPTRRYYAVRDEICLPARTKRISVSMRGYQYW